MSSKTKTPRTAAATLARAKQLVAEGKVEIRNDAAHKGGRAVAVHGFQNGLVFEWNRPGIGFGGVAVVAKDGKLRTDREGMSVEFCMDVIRQAFDEEERP